MADVFISYKSERRPAAFHLHKIFESHGFESWYDYCLIPGEEFEDRLIAELRSAKACVILWCSLSVRSEWVLREAREAARIDTHVPVWIEETELPEEFAGWHTLDLTTWNGDPLSGDLGPLLSGIEKKVARSSRPVGRDLDNLHLHWKNTGRLSLAKFALNQPPASMAEAQLAPHAEKTDADLAVEVLFGTDTTLYRDIENAVSGVNRRASLSFNEAILSAGRAIDRSKRAAAQTRVLESEFSSFLTGLAQSIENYKLKEYVQGSREVRLRTSDPGLGIIAYDSCDKYLGALKNDQALGLGEWTIYQETATRPIRPTR